MSPILVFEADGKSTIPLFWRKFWGAPSGDVIFGSAGRSLG